MSGRPVHKNMPKALLCLCHDQRQTQAHFAPYIFCSQVKKEKNGSEAGKGKNRWAGLVSGETGDLLSSHLNLGTEMRHLNFVSWFFCIVETSPEYDAA